MYTHRITSKFDNLIFGIVDQSFSTTQDMVEAHVLTLQDLGHKEIKVVTLVDAGFPKFFNGGDEQLKQWYALGHPVYWVDSDSNSKYDHAPIPECVLIEGEWLRFARVSHDGYIFKVMDKNA